MSAEAALRRYCAKSVVDDYDRLSAEAKKRMLDAMITCQRDELLQMSSVPDKSGNHFKKQTKKSNEKACPLVRAFLEIGVHAQMLDTENVQKCRSSLATWGDDKIDFAPIEKLFKYQMIVSLQKKSFKRETNEKYNCFHYSLTNSTVVKSGGNVVDWQCLRPIKITDLKLFDTCWGCYLEGVIVGEAIVPIIGGTLLIQDKEGDYLRVSFYNFLPEGVRGKRAEPLLAKMFPMGHKIRIKEPFTKIFRDGLRGIRVDNRSEVDVNTIFSPKQNECSNLFLEEQKAKGNDSFKEKNYSAACDLYISALNGTELIPTLLSNRCQAFISLEQWHEALLDSAASLTIRPNSIKTWKRYNLSFTKLMELNSSEKKNHDIFKEIIPHLKPPQTDKQINRNLDTELADTLKERGNDAFKNKCYTDAILFYTKALLEAGSIVQTLLNNWAQCAIEVDSLNDIVAATCAAIRISVDEKSLYRLCKGLCFLGEYESAIMILTLLSTKSSTLNSLEKDVRTTMSILSSNLKIVDNVKTLIYNTPPLHSRWVGAVEPFMTTDKGRGLRACEDLEIGSLLLIDRALAKAESDMMSFTVNVTPNNTRDDTSTTKLKSDLSHRCQIDCVLSDILSHLADGKSTKQLVPLKSLMRTLDSCKILLPGLFCYFENTQSTLTTENVHDIVSINVHEGDPPKIDDPVMAKAYAGRTTSRDERGTNLFPLIAAINHSSNPNCIPLQGGESCMFLIATKKILKGSELYVSYTANEQVAAEKWKFNKYKGPPKTTKNKKG
jgi:tetratricopeptide (TPR) repeat protein